jgi:hypothetical protein
VLVVALVLRLEALLQEVVLEPGVAAEGVDEFEEKSVFKG